MASEPQGTIWVCVDCLHAEVNGEELPDRDPSQPELWALWPAGSGDVTVGILDEEHDPECDPDVRTYEGCECDHRTFSWSRCEGCGSTLGGERQAFTYWSESE